MSGPRCKVAVARSRGGASLYTAQYVHSGAGRPEASGEKSCKEECGEEETSLGREYE